MGANVVHMFTKINVAELILENCSKLHIRSFEINGLKLL